MARQTEVIERLLDDIDGSAAVETVAFSYDGVNYELDLNRRNAKAFRTDLGKWAERARKVKQARTPTRRRRNAAGTATDSAQVRAWAVEQGIDVPTRGRIPASVLEQYRQA